MDKSLSYYIEMYSGILLGIIAGLYCYFHFKTCCFTIEKDFTDRVITVGSSLFGFLLTILTLVIQGDGPVLSEMKKHKSFKRMIHFNKKVILLSAITVMISFFSIFIKDELPCELKAVLGGVDFGFFMWAIVDTFIYVIIFYKLITVQIEKDE